MTSATSELLGAARGRRDARALLKGSRPARSSSVPLFIVAGSETSARAQVERAKADKLAELRAAGDQREVVFAVNVVITGVVQHGEARDPERAPSAPAFPHGRMRRAIVGPPDSRACRGVAREPRRPPRLLRTEARGEPQPPLVETPICVQIRRA